MRLKYTIDYLTFATQLVVTHMVEQKIVDHAHHEYIDQIMK